MMIQSAYAALSETLHQMVPTSEGSSTALLKIGVSTADGALSMVLDENGAFVDFVDIAPTDIGPIARQRREWAVEANTFLANLGPDDKDEAGFFDKVMDLPADLTSINEDRLKGVPWYVVFWIAQDNGSFDIWAGRFIKDGGELSAGPLTRGVFVFFENQPAVFDPNTNGPVLIPFRAVRSVLFPAYDSVDNATSKATKDLGCHFDQGSGRLVEDWPVSE